MKSKRLKSYNFWTCRYSSSNVVLEHLTPVQLDVHGSPRLQLLKFPFLSIKLSFMALNASTAYQCKWNHHVINRMYDIDKLYIVHSTPPIRLNVFYSFKKWHMSFLSFHFFLNLNLNSYKIIMYILFILVHAMHSWGRA